MTLDLTTKRIQRAHESAAAIINAGQGIKSHIKETLDALNSAYASVQGEHFNEVCRKAALAWPSDLSKYSADVQAHDVPFDLHRVTEAKHKAIFEATGNWQHVEPLMLLRAEVKALPVIAKAPKEPSVEETIKARVIKSFEAEITERRAQFDWAKAVMEEFATIVDGERRLPVTVHVVWCQNQWGTIWTRIDWFLNGRRTPFQVIMAAAQATEKEETSNG